MVRLVRLLVHPRVNILVQTRCLIYVGDAGPALFLAVLQEV